MDDNELDREIEALLAVEPSPEFRAKVRQRVANEPARPVWRVQWTFAAAGVLAAIIVTFVMVRPGAPPAAPNLAARHVEVLLDRAPVAAANAPRGRAASDPLAVRPDASDRAAAGPLVIVYAPEAAAWRRLLAGVSAGRIDAGRLARVEPAMPADTSEEFVLPPVVIEPLTPAMPDQGVHP